MTHETGDLNNAAVKAHFISSYSQHGDYFEFD